MEGEVEVISVRGWVFSRDRAEWGGAAIGKWRAEVLCHEGT